MLLSLYSSCPSKKVVSTPFPLPDTCIGRGNCSFFTMPSKAVLAPKSSSIRTSTWYSSCNLSVGALITRVIVASGSSSGVFSSDGMSVSGVVGLFGSPKNSEYYPNIVREVDTSGFLILEYDEFKVVCIAAKDTYNNSYK